MKLKIKRLFFVFLYFIIVTVGLFCLQEAFVSVYESKDEARLDTAFLQKEESLDAVYLGTSTTYASWLAPYAFENYGITVYSMASAAQPLFASKYIIDDMKRKQSDALYIINITHYLVDYEKYLPNFIETYPLTVNKPFMTAGLCRIGNISAKKTVEMFFPILKYHEKWSELTFCDFLSKKDKYKSASYYKSFLKKSKNVKGIQLDFETKESLSDRDYNGLTDLMNYCKKNNIKALFVIVPQGESCSDRAGKQNTTVSILESRGFDVLDLRRYTEQMNIDPKNDFYNAQHMNINGAKKVTKFMSEFLIEKYGFSDKRGNADYSDWAEAVSEYNKFLLSPTF